MAYLNKKKTAPSDQNYTLKLTNSALVAIAVEAMYYLFLLDYQSPIHKLCSLGVICVQRWIVNLASQFLVCVLFIF
ncbi:hypothetical protein DNHGIG_05730 [Collibacillus ludicampi]|uniref:Uncharacterized protein n=1 Tax=Collibacillus ludicampi TaxID=2771369 RepID=A0AAV4LBE6_9BACL|nr:hypothetical protein DNHGIG_05730 [Collibacillus ludicampi]